VFPELLRKAGVLVFLSVLPLMLMIFWLIRVRLANAYKRKRTGRVVKRLEPSLSAR
jgi:hypothetical protein